MEKPLLILKPSIINALFPIFLKNLFYSFIFVVAVYLINHALKYFNLIHYSDILTITILIVLMFVIPIIPLSYNITKLTNTRYYFYRTHLLSETKILGIEKHSINYSQITNISTVISLWDRISNAGDITLHTGQEQTASLMLSFIRDPHRIEKAIYHLIHKNRN